MRSSRAGSPGPGIQCGNQGSAAPSRQENPQRRLETLTLPLASSAAGQASPSLFTQLYLSEMGLGLPFQLLPSPQQRPFQTRACAARNGDRRQLPLQGLVGLARTLTVLRWPLVRVLLANGSGSWPETQQLPPLKSEMCSGCFHRALPGSPSQVELIEAPLSPRFDS